MGEYVTSATITLTEEQQREIGNRFSSSARLLVRQVTVVSDWIPMLDENGENVLNTQGRPIYIEQFRVDENDNFVIANQSRDASVTLRRV